MSSWARGTVVPLSMLLAHRPYIPITQERGVAELWKDAPENTDLAFREPAAQVLSWENFFLRLTIFSNLLARVPIKPLRRRALRKAERWVLDHQDVNGGWGGIQPATVNSVMALHVLGYPHDHPAMAKGIQAIEDFLIESGGHLFFNPVCLRYGILCGQ